MTFPLRTLYQKIWDAHFVSGDPQGAALLYIDRHLIQEVSSPQAFEWLQHNGMPVRRPQACLAVADHAVPTRQRDSIADPLGRAQVERLVANVAQFDVPYLPLASQSQGIVHVVGPELGFTLPGATLVCGDSHTSTHGAFGTLAFGIGASECTTVLATQCLMQRRSKTMRVRIDGRLGPHASAKDLALALTARIGAGGAAGFAVEYTGEAVSALSMEARMTLCNMAIETGARIGLIAPDAVTFAYLRGRPMAPGAELWDAAVAYWRTLPSDDGAAYDAELVFDAGQVVPTVTWGTSPQDALPVTGRVPDPAQIGEPDQRRRIERALAYMGLAAGTPLTEIAFDRVFIGSCTNARIEDLRLAAGVAKGRHVAHGVSAMVVPGSTAVRAMAEAEGLDRVFIDAGFEWRHAGCSMCVAMNDDRLKPGERCASTSNRNFEGRQGRGGRTHLMSPAMAAAAAIAGHVVDVRDFA